MENRLLVDKNENELQISYHWKDGLAYFMAICTSVWLAFTFFIFLETSIHFTPAYFFVIFGLGLLYYTICLFVNKTVISVTENKFEIFFSSLPWRGNIRVDTAKIDQLHVQWFSQRNSKSLKSANVKVAGLYLIFTDHQSKEIASANTLGNPENMEKIKLLAENFLGKKGTVDIDTLSFSRRGLI